jgi:hypothetical protein
MFRNNLLAAVPVQAGLTDGTNTELVAGRLQPGDAVVLNVLDTNSPGSGAGKR